MIDNDDDDGENKNEYAWAKSAYMIVITFFLTFCLRTLEELAISSIYALCQWSNNFVWAKERRFSS